jgi:hypothetical protein
MRALLLGLLALAVIGPACGVGPGQYTVTAMVYETKGAQPVICAFDFFTFPPQCGGPAVRGVNMGETRWRPRGVIADSISGTRHFRNGAALTQFLRLTGTWDGRALTLTRPPVVATPADATRFAPCRGNGQDPGPTMSPAETQIVRDFGALQERGIDVLEVGQCGTDFLQVILAVADRGSVDYMTSRYGGALTLDISGWFQPIPR